MEGRSLRPRSRAAPSQRSDGIYWEHEGNRAVRDGKWKLVSRHPDRWELYDMEADRSELNDLAAREPGTAARLAANAREMVRARRRGGLGDGAADAVIRLGRTEV